MWVTINSCESLESIRFKSIASKFSMNPIPFFRNYYLEISKTQKSQINPLKAIRINYGVLKIPIKNIKKASPWNNFLRTIGLIFAWNLSQIIIIKVEPIKVNKKRVNRTWILYFSFKTTSKILKTLKRANKNVKIIWKINRAIKI